MYSHQLEKFIELILADGEISEKERNVLHKKAAEEGIDPDEIDVYVDGLLDQMKTNKPATSPGSTSPFSTPDKSKNMKHGQVVKCPNCGSVVEAGSVKCSECNYTFRNVEVVSSRQRLSEMINKVNEKDFSSRGVMGFLGIDFDDVKRDEARAQVISNFPVPNAKEDLLEFLLFLEPLSENKIGNEGGTYSAKAYKAKYKECLKKASIFFSDDPLFQKILHPKKKGLFGGLFSKK